VCDKQPVPENARYRCFFAGGRIEADYQQVPDRPLAGDAFNWV